MGTTLVTYSPSSSGCPRRRTFTYGSMMSPFSLSSDFGRCCPLMTLIRTTTLPSPLLGSSSGLPSEGEI